MKSQEAGQIILGHTILHPKKAGEIALCLQSRHFADAKDRRVFEAVKQCVLAGLEPDLPTVGTKVPELAGYVASLTTMGGTSGNWQYYASIVRNEWKKRQLQVQLKELHATLETENPDRAFADFISEISGFGIDTGRSKEQQIEHLKAEISQNFDRPGQLVGLSLELPTLDEMTGGLMQKEFISLCALTSIGKSAFAHFLAFNRAMEGTPVSLISTEMSAESVWARIAAMASHVNNQNIRKPAGKQQYTEVIDHLDRLKDINLEIVDDISRFEDLCIRIRLDAMRRDTRLVIVDYLQQIVVPDKGEQRYFALQRIVEGLKALAMELNITIIGLCQLNDDAERRLERGAAPSLSTIRESRSIGHASDMVLVLQRARENDGTIQNRGSMYLLKSRNGPVGKVNIEFSPGVFLFEEAAS